MFLWSIPNIGQCIRVYIIELPQTSSCGSRFERNPVFFSIVAIVSKSWQLKNFSVAQNDVIKEHTFFIIIISFYCCWTLLSISRIFPLLILLLHQVNRPGVDKNLGWDTAGTGDPKWPKGYSRPYDVMFRKKKKKCSEWFIQGSSCFKDLTSIWTSVCTSVCMWKIAIYCLCITSFVVFFWGEEWGSSCFLHLLNSLYLNPWVFLLLFFPFTHWSSSGVRSERAPVWVLSCCPGSAQYISLSVCEGCS